MQEFDGVFNGDDVFGARRIDAVNHRSQSCRFTGTGDAGDQNQAARQVTNLFHDFGQIEFVQSSNLGGNDAQHQPNIAALLEYVHTEAAKSGHAVGHVDFRALFELLFLPRRHHAESHGEHVFGADARLIGQRNQLAVDAQVRVVADLQVQVGGAPLHGDAKQVINVHARVP